MSSDPFPVQDPAAFPASYDVASHRIACVRADRTLLLHAAFLDERLTAAAMGAWPVADIRAPEVRSADLILHTAFCCSTLLSRCLTVDGVSLALREPGILMDVANALRTVHAERRAPMLAALECAMALLARPHAPGERVFVKPTNAAAILNLPLLERADRRAVLLFSRLRAFLISVLKKGEAGRHFVRTLYNIFALDGTGLGRIPARQAMTFTDLQVAALVWRHQVEQFQHLLELFPTRVRLLDGDRFLAAPAATLRVQRDFLGLEIDDAVIDAIAASDLLTRDAKEGGRDFDAGTRSDEAREVERRFGSELDLIGAWAARLVLDRDIDADFGGDGRPAT